MMITTIRAFGNNDAIVWSPYQQKRRGTLAEHTRNNTVLVSWIVVLVNYSVFICITLDHDPQSKGL